MVPVLIKKVLYKVLGPDRYLYFQFLGKARDLRLGTVWEKELHLLPLVVRPGETTLDIGANYALYCYHLARAVGEKGQVHAFEPIPFTYQVCDKLVRHFELKNVHLYNKGCGDRNGKAIFETPLQSFGAISAGQAHLSGRMNDMEGKERHYKFKEAAKVECEIVRLDDFLPDMENLSFMKFDIEGSEYFALQGAKALIAKHHPIILCEINPFFLKGFKIDLKVFLDFMAGLGYRLYFYSFQDGRHHITETRAEDVVANNYLFIHPDRWDRVKAMSCRT